MKKTSGKLKNRKISFQILTVGMFTQHKCQNTKIGIQKFSMDFNE